MIEKLMDRLFKKNITVEETKEGFLPDERRTLWAIICGLIILQLYMFYYMKTIWIDEANLVLREVNKLTNLTNIYSYGGQV